MHIEEENMNQSYLLSKDMMRHIYPSIVFLIIDAYIIDKVDENYG